MSKVYNRMYCVVISEEGSFEFVTKLSESGEILETSKNYNDAKCSPPSEQVSTAVWYYQIRVKNIGKYPRMRCLKEWESVSAGKI